MKYRPLTKEQFEELHEEFAHFLATQAIDAKEWKELKQEKPALAKDEMNIFSDIVWDDVLTKTQYLEHFSPKMLNLFKCEKDEIHRIMVTVDKDINLLEEKGFKWLMQNSNNEKVSFFTGTIKYKKERNIEVFNLIEKGSSIAKGDIYTYFNKIIS